MQQLVARRWLDGQVVRICWQADRLRRVETLRGVAHPEQYPLVAPGLVDIQINGYAGQEFSSPKLTAEKVIEIVRRMWAYGITGMCPTLTTQSDEVFQHALGQIDEACRQDLLVAASVLGVHLEGPFISREDGPRGAHPAQHCRAPDWNSFQRWQQRSGGRVRLVTLSPEYDQAVDFIRRAVSSGVTVAIGHTAASCEQILEAVDAGARLSTHLGNGVHRTLPRHPNYLWTQLAEDRLMASLIADGYHLPQEVVRVMVRAKGVQRCVLVSDLAGLAGLPPGEYESSGGPVEILPDGRLVIAGQRQLLAGASLPLGTGVVNTMHMVQLSLAQALAMATENPLRVLGIPVRELLPGHWADLVVFRLPDSWPVQDPQTAFSVVATVLRGQVVFGNLPGE